jgi:hypothetical protein
MVVKAKRSVTGGAGGLSVISKFARQRRDAAFAF